LSGTVRRTTPDPRCCFRCTLTYNNAQHMKVSSYVQRFLVPGWIKTIVYAVRFGARVSPRAEVDLSSNLKLSAGTNVSSFCKVKSSEGPLAIGANSHIATGCFLASGPAGLTIGDDCLVGPNCAMTASNYAYERLDIPIRLQGTTSKGIRIGNNVQIAANCIVLDGTMVEDNVIVSAGSVISGKIPANSMAAGNPAKVVFVRR
jgi:acetyltransferase-like isoleucine patch superfamily enzyme